MLLEITLIDSKPQLLAASALGFQNMYFHCFNFPCLKLLKPNAFVYDLTFKAGSHGNKFSIAFYKKLDYNLRKKKRA